MRRARGRRTTTSDRYAARRSESVPRRDSCRRLSNRRSRTRLPRDADCFSTGSRSARETDRLVRGSLVRVPPIVEGRGRREGSARARRSAGRARRCEPPSRPRARAYSASAAALDAGVGEGTGGVAPRSANQPANTNASSELSDGLPDIGSSLSRLRNDHACDDPGDDLLEIHVLGQGAIVERDAVPEHGRCARSDVVGHDEASPGAGAPGPAPSRRAPASHAGSRRVPRTRVVLAWPERARRCSARSAAPRRSRAPRRANARDRPSSRRPWPSAGEHLRSALESRVLRSRSDMRPRSS